MGGDRMRWPAGVDGLCFGGDYNPEQWSPEVWREDVALMRQAGVNLVTVGVFSWSSLEPEPGRYEFGWLDEVLDLLHDNGIKVNLATPTASPPPWFSLAHPEALPVSSDGVRLTHGSRDTYCVCAPAYRKAAAGIATVLADRYAGHPALAMWHVHNEYGSYCYCDLAASAFRRWLQERYGELERLNAAWTTAFWSQGYSAWEQIQPPRKTQYLANPTHALDYRRFLSDELLAAYCEQRDILNERTPFVPVTTNFVFAPWAPVDHARWAEEVDLVALDHYPETADIGAEEQTAFCADLARGWAGGGPWLLMEQASSVLNEGGRMHTKEPGRMARLSLSHIARGSRGAMFFQWRASRGGSEMYHAAMVPHAGPDSRIFREVAELGALLPAIAEIDEGRPDADVAILWDAESWWALQAPILPSPRLDYLAAVRAMHRQFWRAGVGVDFVAPGTDLSRYRLVVVPSLYLTSDASADSLGEYVESGGHALVTYFSGIVDENVQVRLGGYPGAFTSLLGLRVDEFYPLADGEAVGLTGGGEGTIWSESVHLAGAEAITTYAEGPLAGMPAITRHPYGNGQAWYASTQLTDDAFAPLIAQALHEAGQPLPNHPAGVELIRRTSDTTQWLIAINHTNHPADLPANGLDLLTGKPIHTTLTLTPGTTAIIRTPHP